MKQPHFTLHKWASPDNQEFSSEEAKFEEDELLHRKSSSPHQNQGTSLWSGICLFSTFVWMMLLLGKKFCHLEIGKINYSKPATNSTVLQINIRQWNKATISCKKFQSTFPLMQKIVFSYFLPQGFSLVSCKLFVGYFKYLLMSAFVLLLIVLLFGSTLEYKLFFNTYCFLLAPLFCARKSREATWK